MKTLRLIIDKIMCRLIPNLQLFNNCSESIKGILPIQESVKKHGKNIRIAQPSQLRNVAIENYTYIGQNANIYGTEIGKFCSIGPNFVCGIGSHPTNGLSTAPMFYSAENRSNGTTLCKQTKFEERSKVQIGNDVFIGANVFVLNGIKIGNGVIIGAGAVITKDIPNYAIVAGVPAKIIKYRFTESQIEKLQKIQWWNFSENKLTEVEHYFYDVDGFIEKYK
ncbi:MAG: CatB-related O-acetyltransferase [Bacteroidales bacterium]|nr:CatB-related O-acetyltransferase [Bacteroidales bacterium]